MVTIAPLASLNPASVQKGTGSYTIPAGYHGFFSGSAASASAAAGGVVGGTSSYTIGPVSNPQTHYYGWGGSGSGSGSGAGMGSGKQWLNAGTAITVATTNTGTTDAVGSSKILIDAVTVFGAVSRGYSYIAGSGANVVHVGWSISLFLNAP